MLRICSKTPPARESIELELGAVEGRVEFAPRACKSALIPLPGAANCGFDAGWAVGAITLAVGAGRWPMMLGPILKGLARIRPAPNWHRR